MTLIYKYDDITSLCKSLSSYEFSLLSSSLSNIELKIESNNDINYYSIKAVKYNSITNEKNIILCVNYYINTDNIKIDYLNINNDYYANKYDEIKIIDDNELKLIKNSICDYIKYIANINDIPKIIIDVHSNLERYNKELKDIGFINTNKKCIDNPFWYETELILKNDYK